MQFKYNRTSEFGSNMPDSSENFEMTIARVNEASTFDARLKKTSLVSYIDFYKKSKDPSSLDAFTLQAGS
jgi:hypothetical protein